MIPSARTAASAIENGASASRAALKPKPLGLGDGLAMGRPLKEIMNLTTKTDTLTFSPDSQVRTGASYPPCIPISVHLPL